MLKEITDLFKNHMLDQLRENDRKFEMLYLTLKTHSNIAMLFRDMAESVKVLKELKEVCNDLMKYTHKMHVYH
jgi:hypothetical protein